MLDIKGFIESSLLEWEGKIACVVFLPNCNLRCSYCHAAHLILHPERLESLDLARILDYARRQGAWLDGVVITGGEPTLHGEELLDLIGDFRAVPLEVMIETNGTRPQWVERLIEEGFLDAIAMDLKAPLTPDDYARVAGVEVNVDDVRRSVELIKQSGLPHEFRITLVPGLVGRDELERMAPDLAGARQVALQNFRPDFCLSESLRQVAPYTPEELEALVRVIAPSVGRVVLRGRDHAAIAASRSMPTRRASS
jgi:pyruvate formate lyase activating enzyme